MFMQPQTTRTTASETKTQQVEKGGEWIEGASSRNTVPSGPREKTFGPSRLHSFPTDGGGRGDGPVEGLQPPLHSAFGVRAERFPQTKADGVARRKGPGEHRQPKRHVCEFLCFDVRGPKEDCNLRNSEILVRLQSSIERTEW